VPDLVGKSLEEARRLLAEIGLQVAPDIRYVRTTDVPEGRIVWQKPGKHKRVERKTAVELEVSEGVPPDEDIAPPDDTYVYHLSWTLPDVANDILVRVEMTDAMSTRTIFEQKKAPNEQIDIDAEGLGRQATFHIYYDNELVQTITKSAGDDGGDDVGGDPPPIDPDPEVIRR
jgi:beta-lactam-binding protein with PASTA domain